MYSTPTEHAQAATPRAGLPEILVLPLSGIPALNYGLFFEHCIIFLSCISEVCMYFKFSECPFPSERPGEARLSPPARLRHARGLVQVREKTQHPCFPRPPSERSHGRALFGEQCSSPGVPRPFPPDHSQILSLWMKSGPSLCPLPSSSHTAIGSHGWRAAPEACGMLSSPQAF